MSHFTRLKTHMVEKEFLIKALEDLGYNWETSEQGLEVRNLGVARQKVEIRVKLGGLFGRQVGFARSGSNYEIIADWSGVARNEREKFANQITQRYAYHAARAKLQAQGFDLLSEEQSENGQIRLVLRRANYS
jgi:hypothetical protein